jgi:hypothetical protein
MARALARHEEVSPPAISLRRNLPDHRKRPPGHRSRPRTPPSRILENPPLLEQVRAYQRFAPLSLLYHPVRPQQNPLGNRYADLFGGFQTDDKFELLWLLHTEVGSLGALEKTKAFDRTLHLR